MTRSLTVLAFDPGVETGYAVVEYPHGTGTGAVGPPRVVAVGSMPYHEAVIDLVNAGSDNRVDALVVEDGSDLPVYARHDRTQGRRRDALARAVGQTDARAQELARIGRALGYLVVTVPPAAGKWGREELADRTGYTAATNAHGRDAVRAAFHPDARAALAEIAAAPSP